MPVKAMADTGIGGVRAACGNAQTTGDVQIARGDMQTRAGHVRAASVLVDVVNAHLLNLPDARFIYYVRSDAYSNVLDALAEDEYLPGSLREGARMMRGYIAVHACDAMESLSREMGIDRTRLYRGVTPQYSPPYPAEAVWKTSGGEQAARLIEKVSATYRDAGIMIDPHANERLDYLGVELKFLSFLLDQQIESLDAGDGEAAVQWATCAKRFSDDHLDWIAAFVDAALPFATTDFYRGHLMMLKGFPACAW